MEATTELQHVGWHWKFYKGERKHTSPATEVESIPSGYFGSGWYFTYYGSADIRWSEVSQRLYVEVLLGHHSSLMNYAHWQHFRRDTQVLYKHYYPVQSLYLLILHGAVKMVVG